MEKYIDETGATRVRSNTPSLKKQSVYPGYEDYLQWATEVLEDKPPKEQKQMLKWYRSKNAKQAWGTPKAARMRAALRKVMGE